MSKRLQLNGNVITTYAVLSDASLVWNKVECNIWLQCQTSLSTKITWAGGQTVCKSEFSKCL